MTVIGRTDRFTGMTAMAIIAREEAGRLEVERPFGRIQQMLGGQATMLPRMKAGE
jgi:hypothetical protein